MNVRKALERVLLQVQKPARYTGGELGSVVKDAASVDVRFAFCFPDLYEVGMSHPVSYTHLMSAKRHGIIGHHGGSGPRPRIALAIKDRINALHLFYHKIDSLSD